MKPVKEMTTAELLAEYNKLTNSNVKRFATRTAAERRVEGARADAAKASAKPAKAPKPAKDAQARSLAIRESWASRDVAAARSERTNVEVNGETYRSVAEAFKQLNLPMGKHIKFRAVVKADGKADFEHNNKTFRFKVVKAAA